MTKLFISTVLAAALLLTACSSNPKSQLEANQGKDSRNQDSLFSIRKKNPGRVALEVPPDLLESANDKVRENQAGADADPGEYEVLPQVIGASIESSGGKSWLKIDADAEVVWRKLTDFWAFEEVDLVDFQPESGLMETDWFVKTSKPIDDAGFKTFTSDLYELLISRDTARDKFTIRLERNGANGTNLYATHRSRQKLEQHYANRAKTSDFEWVERAQDPEKIAQLLQTLVLLFDSTADESEKVQAGAGVEPA